MSRALGAAAARRRTSARVATLPVGLFGDTTAMTAVSASSRLMNASMGKASSCHGMRTSSPPASVALQSNMSKLGRSEEHTSELQSLAYLVCRLLLEKKKKFRDWQAVSARDNT